MKNIVDSYIGIWLIMLFLMLGLAFTSINLHTVLARKLFSDFKARVQAGTVTVPDTGFHYDYLSPDHKFKYTCNIRQYDARDELTAEENETWIYGKLYYVELVYTYVVPLFGEQVYPIRGYTY